MRLIGLQLELRVPGIGGNAWGERHAHVQEFRSASHKPVMISPAVERRGLDAPPPEGGEGSFSRLIWLNSGAHLAVSGEWPNPLNYL